MTPHRPHRHFLFALYRALRSLGHQAVADTVLFGAKWWHHTTLPWVMPTEEGQWRIEAHEEMGFVATLDGELVATPMGAVAKRDDPIDGHHSIKIADSHWRALREVGEGNASKALRAAVASYLEEHGRLF